MTAVSRNRPRGSEHTEENPELSPDSTPDNGQNAEGLEATPAAQDTAQMQVMRDVVSGNAWSKLLNGQRVEIVKASRPDIIAGVNIKIKEVERGTAEDVDIADPHAADIIDEQLHESHLQAQEVNVLTAIFREYGPDVWLLKKIDVPEVGQDTERGLDPKQMGNRTEFDDGMIFVIAASRADEMKSLFENPPAVSSGAVASKFDVEPRWNYLGNEGFIVKYRHPDTDIISEIRFLYSRDSHVKKPADLQASREDQKGVNEPLANVQKAA